MPPKSSRHGKADKKSAAKIRAANAREQKAFLQEQRRNAALAEATVQQAMEADEMVRKHRNSGISEALAALKDLRKVNANIIAAKANNSYTPETAKRAEYCIAPSTRNFQSTISELHRG